MWQSICKTDRKTPPLKELTRSKSAIIVSHVGKHLQKRLEDSTMHSHKGSNHLPLFHVWEKFCCNFILDTCYYLKTSLYKCNMLKEKNSISAKNKGNIFVNLGFQFILNAYFALNQRHLFTRGNTLTVKKGIMST